MESHGLRTPRVMAGDGFRVLIPYRYAQLFVAVHFPHEHRRGFRVAIQRKDLEYGAFLSICLTGAE